MKFLIKTNLIILTFILQVHGSKSTSFPTNGADTDKQNWNQDQLNAKSQTLLTAINDSNQIAAKLNTTQQKNITDLTSHANNVIKSDTEKFETTYNLSKEGIAELIKLLPHLITLKTELITKLQITLSPKKQVNGSIIQRKHEYLKLPKLKEDTEIKKLTEIQEIPKSEDRHQGELNYKSKQGQNLIANSTDQLANLNKIQNTTVENLENIIKAVTEHTNSVYKLTERETQDALNNIVKLADRLLLIHDQVKALKSLQEKKTT
ncbi:MAG: hypothetical protein UR26_C0003G0095 [candidate division TM6 bacterium GW2011_GWF2_32_72]|nr:MAG: hypothetical protein UR26_C0003G0095 [candidate division TM6 bacterium GW2011_GWF2_32_72]